MTDTVIHSSAPIRYRQLFLCGLLVATFLPAVTIFINYQVSDSIYSVVWLVSAIVALGNAHPWLTLAYYTDKEWLAHFRRYPVTFFLVPLGIIASSVLWMLAVPKSLGFVLIFGSLSFNLWHHSKQNWGILAIIGRIRGQNVSALRIPLCWAWPFFIIPLAMAFPDITRFVSQPLLFGSSLACALLYVGFFGAHAWSGGFLKAEPLTCAFGLALAPYFLPMVLLFGKPYGIAFWAVAHGLQYLLMVLTSLSLKERTSLTAGKLAFNLGAVGSILSLIVVTWYVVAQTMGGPDPWTSAGGRVALGLAWGMPLVHFWIDAFIWKFSEKEIRQLHGEAFAL